MPLFPAIYFITDHCKTLLMSSVTFTSDLLASRPWTRVHLCSMKVFCSTLRGWSEVYYRRHKKGGKASQLWEGRFTSLVMVIIPLCICWFMKLYILCTYYFYSPIIVSVAGKKWWEQKNYTSGIHILLLTLTVSMALKITCLPQCLSFCICKIWMKVSNNLDSIINEMGDLMRSHKILSISHVLNKGNHLIIKLNLT